VTLEEYITETFVSITKGVAQAQEDALLYIAPGYVNGVRQDEAQNVRIEVATTINNDGGGKISVVGIAKMGGKIASESVNRVTFDVPVHFAAPTIKNSRHHKNEGPPDPIDDVLAAQRKGKPK
jgi:hypothetical protein